MNTPNTTHDTDAGLPRTEVGLYARVVPHGVVNGQAQLTLLLTPDIDATGGPRLALQSWPAESMRHVETGGFQIEISPVPRVDNAQDLRPSRGRFGSVSFPGLAAVSGTTRNKLTALWQSNLNAPDAPDLEAYWESLAQLVADTTRSGSTRPEAGGLSDEIGELDDEHFGTRGQIKVDLADQAAMANTTRNVRAVLDVPHGDLALALEVMRVDELRDSLWHALCDTHPEAETEAANRRGITPADEDVAEPPEVERLGPFLGLLDSVVTVGNTFVNGPVRVTPEHLVYLQGLRSLETLLVPSDNPDVNDTLNRRIYDRAIEEIRRLSKADIRREKIARRNEIATNDALAKNRRAAKKAFVEESNCLGQALEEVVGPVAAPLSLSDASEQYTREEMFEAACMAHEHATYPEFTDTDDPRNFSQMQEDRAQAERSHAVNLAARRFFALQSNPSLSRVFGLAFETLIDASTFAGDGFYWIRATGADDAPFGPWTLCKLAGNALWPVTEEEMHADCVAHDSPRGAPPQINGFLPLSCPSGEPNCPLRQYDLTSIDIRTATEMEIQRRQSVWQANLRAARREQRDEETDAAEKASNAEFDTGSAFQTAGLTLINRGAQRDVARRLARIAFKAEDAAAGLEDEVVLDAVDLTMGQRLFVGVPGAEWQTDWHNLMLRDVSYAETGPSDRDAVVTALNALVGPFQSGARRALDAALLSAPSRMLPCPSEESEGVPVEAMVEQAQFVWDGGPKGVDCSAQGGLEDALPIGRDYFLPTRGTAPAEDLPAPLRFGQGYRFALAAVYSGGHSRGPEALSEEAQLAYPPKGEDSSQKPFFRFLRQTKVNAPQVLLPQGHADRTRVTTGWASYYVSAARTCGPMGYDAGRQLVVRSMRNEQNRAYTGMSNEEIRLRARATPEIAQRVILPPNVPFEDAARHGVFDDVHAARPVGSFSGIEFGPAGESFPVTQLHADTGADGRRFASGRVKTRQADADVNAGTTGDAVFAPGSGRSRHYADPGADFIAFAFRLKGARDYLEGEVCLPITGARHLMIEPIIFTVERQDAPRTEEVTHAHTLLADTSFRRRHFDPTRRDDVMLGSRHPHVREVRLRLAPGEMVEIDCWCVPSAARLAREFALVESFANVLCQRAAPDRSGSVEALCAALPSCLHATHRALFEEHLGEIAGDMDDLAFVGPGGTVTPPARAIRATAAFLHSVLRCRPLPELAAPVRLDAVHAINRAPEKPSVTVTETPPEIAEAGIAPEALLGLDEVRALRPDSAELALPEVSVTNDEEPCETETVIEVAATGSTEFVLAGQVRIDLASVGAFEVKARMILPGSSDFDDPRRGRSLAAKRAGDWPKLRDLEGQFLVNDAQEMRFVTAESLFGFKLAPDGTTSIDPAEVTLLKVENLPLRWPGAPDLRHLRLIDFFAPENALPEGVRVTHRHQFVDGKARVMKLWINAISRTAPLLATVDRVASENDPWLTPRNGLIRTTRDMLRAEPVPAKALEQLSDETTVLLPATQRPGLCDARGPVPVFQWSDGTLAGGGRWQRRRTRIRIPLGRSWFSSGEGEKLGVVLWPPDLHLGVGAQENHVPLHQAEDARYPERRVNVGRLQNTELPSFEDRDLGPGGAFVTRRGGDPVRAGFTQETKMFLAAKDFTGVQLPGQRPLAPRDFEAEWVGNVTMPIQPEAPPDDTTPEPAAQDLHPPLNVGLLLYEPRFDPVREEWYVDIGVKPSKTAEPFIRFGLVRYQPNTVPALRCSPPVTQWAQPMPERWAIARMTAAGGFQIRVWGRASRRRAVLDNRVEDAAPRMRAMLFEETQDASGHLRRRWIKSEPRVATASLRYGRGPEMAWRFQFDPPGPVNGVLKVFIEEIERFPRASFDDEPVHSSAYETPEGENPHPPVYTGDATRDGGARFTTSFDLSSLMPIMAGAD